MKHKKHPFPMYIEAHSGSSVIVGGYGHTSTAGGASAPADELEAELLRNFRALSIRGRVEVLQSIYEICEETKKAPTCKGRGKIKVCCGSDG